MKAETTFQKYIEALQEILKRIQREQAVPIQEAGILIAQVLSRGGILHTFGTGHSHLIAEEAFFRAGGLVPVNPILDGRLAFLAGALESTRAEREQGYAKSLLLREQIQAGDAAILISNSGSNCAPVEMALEMRVRGVHIVAITNVSQSSQSASRHSSGKRLFELADIVIDTCVPRGDALLALPGLAYPIGASSTIAGSAIVNSVMIETAAELLRQGQKTPVLPSANLPDTTEESLSALLRPYANRIRLLADA